jgi:hypothetical protein
MVDGRQLFPREGGVGGRFVPAHATHRKIVLPFGVGAELPCGRTRPARGILELTNRLLPGQCPPVLHEGLPPIGGRAIAARVDELFELPIRDLVGIDPEVRKIH